MLTAFLHYGSDNVHTVGSRRTHDPLQRDAAKRKRPNGRHGRAKIVKAVIC